MVQLQFDARFVDHKYDLWALGEYLSTMEAQLTYLRDQDRVQTMAELAENGLSADEEARSLALQALDERAEIINPRLFRGPFLVALWGCYEATIINLAERIARERAATIQHHDLRGESILVRLKKYFDSYLGVALDVDAERTERLAHLYVVRNAFAHANGLLRANSARGQYRIEEVVKRNPTISVDSGFVIPSAEYLRDSYRDVSTSARDLISRAEGSAALR